MTTNTEVSVHRTNKDVARSMLIVGASLLAIGVIMTFSSDWFAEFVNGGGDGYRRFILHVWSAMAQIAYPLGSFLVAGSIIVGRLPERRSGESA